MADDGFNGSTATFAAVALGHGLRAVRRNEGGGNADVSASGDTQKTWEAGLIDLEITIEFVGTTTSVKNDKGTLVITWNDGTSDTLTNAICTAVSVGGSMDTEISGSATFKPSTAA
jgi:hypothetical protein